MPGGGEPQAADPVQLRETRTEPGRRREPNKGVPVEDECTEEDGTDEAKVLALLPMPSRVLLLDEIHWHE